MTDPRYLTRADVGLRPPRGLRPLPVPVRRLYIHHTVTAGLDGPREWRAVQAYHMDRKRDPMADVAYHGAIGPQAEVMEGRPPQMMGGATLGWNDESLSVVFVGTFTDRPPTDAQLRSAAWLAQLWILMGLLAPDFELRGHRDDSTSSCPGDALYARLGDLGRLIRTPAPVQPPEDDLPAHRFVKRRPDEHGNDERVYLVDDARSPGRATGKARVLPGTWEETAFRFGIPLRVDEVDPAYLNGLRDFGPDPT